MHTVCTPTRYPEAMRLRRGTIELPLSAASSAIRACLLRGSSSAQTEISLATMAYNIERTVKALGASEAHPPTEPV